MRRWKNRLHVHDVVTRAAQRKPTPGQAGEEGKIRAENLERGGRGALDRRPVVIEARINPVWNLLGSRIFAPLSYSNEYLR